MPLSMDGHVIRLLPVGWGFMLTHQYAGNMIVTDGGSIGPCLPETIRKLGRRLRQSPPRRWAWILSHLDYDHYSLTVKLVNSGAWKQPDIVILPSVYKVSECRDLRVAYLTLAHILAETLNLRLPSIVNLVNLLKSSRGAKIGVSQGSILKAGGLRYHIIWPPLQLTISQCKELLNIFKDKIEKYIRKCKEKKKKHYTICDNVDKLEGDIRKLIEVLEPDELSEGEMNIDRYFSRGYNEISSRNRYFSREYNKISSRKYNSYRLILEKDSTQIFLYEQIYTYASTVLKDVKLERLHKSVLNIYSIAYMIESNNLNNTVIFYPADLDGYALADAITYYVQHKRLHSVDTLVEVAPHHGNAYSNRLSKINPEYLYIPRCDCHVEEYWLKNFKYQHRFRKLRHSNCNRIIFSRHEKVFKIYINSRILCYSQYCI